MLRKSLLISLAFLILIVVVLLTIQYSAFAWMPTSVVNDYLVRMPGTQPSASHNLRDSSQCDSCHQNNNTPVTIVHDWQGSMMTHAARDFLFYATMTVAAQDAIWAIGNPNATDICIRCHFPLGWLNGRSDPTNASLMEDGDFDGVQCTICHYMVDPFYDSTFDGSREGSDWTGYWDEAAGSSLSSTQAANTYAADQSLASGITMFNGSAFFTNDRPPATYTENGSGQYFIDTTDHRRASFADVSPNHNWLYSRYHKSKYFCGTCHDISNPVLANQYDDPLNPLTTETQPSYSYYHVERTFSEFMLSEYGQQGGAPGVGPFDPTLFATSRPGDVIASCQDCHMRDTTGQAAGSGVLRPTGSTEHPNSGQPMHDLTGGNVWVPTVLASADSGSTNHDATNEGLLNSRNSPSLLTLDLGAQAVGYDDPDAILDGADRSLQMLQMAAGIEDVRYNPTSGNLSFEVHNYTGHKLISGFPEGRRMFVNIKYLAADGSLLHEINPYDATAGTLKGLTYPYDGGGVLPDPAALTTNETYVDELVYEMHGGSTISNETETFHFVLSDGRYKDNRIPPKGFDINNAPARLSEPVWHGVSASNYFTDTEYAGGYDLVSMQNDLGINVTNAMTVAITLNYQTTSREYIEFLRNEINGTGTLTLSGTGAGGDPPYIIQDTNETFFDALRAWGDTIWSLWTHNMTLPGATPIVIASGSWDPSSPTAVTLSATSATDGQAFPRALLFGAVILLGITAVYLRESWLLRQR